MNDLNLIDPSISQLNETAVANILLLYGDLKRRKSQKSKILYIYIYIYIYIINFYIFIQILKI